MSNTETLRVVEQIQARSTSVIEICYRDFLLQNGAADREFPDAADQVREYLIHANYLSQYDIKICLGFDVESLADAGTYRLVMPDFTGIERIRLLEARDEHHERLAEQLRHLITLLGDAQTAAVVSRPPHGAVRTMAVRKP